MIKMSETYNLNHLIERDEFVKDEELKQQYQNIKADESKVEESVGNKNVNLVGKCMKFDDFIQSMNQE